VDTILIEQLEFYAYHGASDEEQFIGHRYAVDVELGIDISQAGRTDALADTVNYGEVAQRILEIGTSRQFRLLEALAATLAEAILSEFPVESVHLRVRKLHPPMPAIAASVGVVIERRR
jgi:7,8-dihydroneopterin aldolase/epimerase/oxygenase